MKPSQHVIALAASAAIAVSLAPATPVFANPILSSLYAPASSEVFLFQHDRVLGTSLDLQVICAKQSQAVACQNAIFLEIARLSRIFNIYDPNSEITRVKNGGAVESPELAQLLNLYAHWNSRTGVLAPNLSMVIDLWKNAKQTQPAREMLQNAYNNPLALNLNALGKGFVIDRAVQVAQKHAPSGLLDIGGDLRAWGDVPFVVGVADPYRPAENAPLLGTFILQNKAIASSGSYARGMHIIDPRTLAPTQALAGATVVANDCVTANALSTSACILGMEEGKKVASLWGTGHVLVAASAPIEQSGLTPASQPATQPAADMGIWKDNLVTIGVNLKTLDRAKRPYVAVWVVDSAGKYVRTITVWGNRQWTRDMTNWVKSSGGSQQLTRSVARATRGPGKYTVEWDGLDDNQKPLPPGKYTVFVEVNRERGGHTTTSAEIDCTGETKTATLKATAEADEATVTFGAKPKP